MNDMGRDQVIWDCLESLKGAPEMEFNPSNQRLFQACLAVERDRPDNVVCLDRFMSIFEFCTRWGPMMNLEMLLDPTKTVADVAERAAFEAGPESSDTGLFIATASVIMIKCWKNGDGLREWFEGSRYYRYLNPPRQPLAFPLYYLYEPKEVKKATLRWKWKK
jgi:hypothetical protein